jgi:hypothetical protein
MPTWIIELSVTPPFERINQNGLLVHLEVADDNADRQARLWARSWHGMSWMEEVPLLGGRVGNPVQLNWDDAKSLLIKARSAHVVPVCSGTYGLHSTEYRLKISSGLNVCEFAWANQPPSEWAILGEVAKTLEMWGGAHASYP